MALITQNTMDEIVPGLWIGGIHAVADHDALREHNICSILSCMRGKIQISETFTHFQIQLDDTEDADALAFFPQCISFIDSELDQGRSVLVHCQAGMSRSATIVCAYLMYSKQLDAKGALELVTKARPCSQPNPGFLAQLDVFYEASYKISKKNKAMRMYYLERALDEIMNGDGSLPSTTMFPSFPHSPGESTPTTPGGSIHPSPRRRIRCKMCRTELAAREHMLDHGQVGPATPAPILSPALSPVASRRPSSHAHDGSRPFVHGLGMNPLSPMTPMTSRQTTSSCHGSFGATGVEKVKVNTLATLNGEPVPITIRRLSGTSGRPSDLKPLTPASRSGPVSRTGSFVGTEGGKARRPSGLQSRPFINDSENIGDSSAVADDDEDEEEHDIRQKVGPETDGKASNFRKTTDYMSASDLAAQLHSNPKLAALRGGVGGINGLQALSPMIPSHSKVSMAQSPPLLINNSCSGYFVEPMKWMEPFLEKGELAGKIICPNKACGAKLGNYDWAGVCCSCKEWVTPGFCIHKSKVDEITV